MTTNEPSREAMLSEDRALALEAASEMERLGNEALSMAGAVSGIVHPDRVMTRRLVFEVTAERWFRFAKALRAIDKALSLSRHSEDDVERVARAMIEARVTNDPTRYGFFASHNFTVDLVNSIVENSWKSAIPEARAAIAALIRKGEGG